MVSRSNPGISLQTEKIVSGCPGQESIVPGEKRLVSRKWRGVSPHLPAFLFTQQHKKAGLPHSR
ncbi:hypothetical protein ASZ90_015425 [hydrocarbon metagenome]|uniref:Uncharacterized protein n=1 Tax=hydrocarbon metagenome TaxID=938273 RepID=A0A0W8F218_9ZZZZ